MFVLVFGRWSIVMLGERLNFLFFYLFVVLFLKGVYDFYWKDRIIYIFLVVFILVF